MTQYLNTSQVPLSLAVFLASDSYDHEENVISATTLLKPIRQVILSSRIAKEDQSVDLIQMLPSRMGSAIHDAIETSWTTNYDRAMTALGYPKKIIERVIINPNQEEELPDWAIPIYLEQRAYKQVGKHRVSGKFDFVGEGFLEDFKNTSVYTYINGTKDDDYIWQGSIYRWLNPEKITSDHIYIQFLFTDWQRAEARRNSNYPQHKALEYPVPLPSDDDVQDYVVGKIKELSRLWNSPEEHLPPCTDKELWRSDPQFKYYLDPAKANDPNSRSTKNFDNLAEANAFAAEKGKGVVVTKMGEPKACTYCPAFDNCKQKDAYFAQGD